MKLRESVKRESLVNHLLAILDQLKNLVGYESENFEKTLKSLEKDEKIW